MYVPLCFCYYRSHFGSSRQRYNLRQNYRVVAWRDGFFAPAADSPQDHSRHRLPMCRPCALSVLERSTRSRQHYVVTSCVLSVAMSWSDARSWQTTSPHPHLHHLLGQTLSHHPHHHVLCGCLGGHAAHILRFPMWEIMYCGFSVLFATRTGPSSTSPLATCGGERNSPRHPFPVVMSDGQGVQSGGFGLLRLSCLKTIDCLV